MFRESVSNQTVLPELPLLVFTDEETYNSYKKEEVELHMKYHKILEEQSNARSN